MNIVGFSSDRYLRYMVSLDITIFFVRQTAGTASASVLAVRPGRAVIHLQLEFPLAPSEDPVQAAYDEALAYLDIA